MVNGLAECWKTGEARQKAADTGKGMAGQDEANGRTMQRACRTAEQSGGQGRADVRTGKITSHCRRQGAANRSITQWC